MIEGFGKKIKTNPNPRFRESMILCRFLGTRKTNREFVVLRFIFYVVEDKRQKMGSTTFKVDLAKRVVI